MNSFHQGYQKCALEHHKVCSLQIKQAMLYHLMTWAVKDDLRGTQNSYSHSETCKSLGNVCPFCPPLKTLLWAWMCSRGWQSGSTFWLCLLAVSSWINDIISLCLNFPIHKMGINSTGYCHIKMPSPSYSIPFSHTMKRNNTV